MAIKDVESKCWILALFVRDDGERFLLGDGSYEFEEKQLHFVANAMANDVVEVQGNDGYMLAGQVRRPSTQTFDGYVGDSSTSRATVEERRRAFFAFFRKNFFYKVIYVFPDGSAIQRKRGFLVDAPEVKEIRQIYPEYHVALNFEDINYYYYDEDASGEEIYGKSAAITLNSVAQSGGLIWLLPSEVTLTGEGTSFTLSGATNGTELTSAELKGNTYQQTYSGKNLFAMPSSQTVNAVTMTVHGDGTFDLSGTASATGSFYVIKPLSETNLIGGDTYTLHIPQDMQWTLPIFVQSSQADGTYSKQLIAGGLQIGTSKTAVLENPDTQYVRFVIQVINGSTYNLQNFYVQLEKGSTATSYEPYVGGIPSPNPDYPQEVQTATGRQVVTVSGSGESQEYEVNLGKNLLDVSQLSQAAANVGQSVVDGVLSDSTPDGDNRSWGYLASNWTIMLEPGTYTLSETFVKSCTNGSIGGVRVYTENGTRLVDNTSGRFINVARVADTFTIAESTSIGIMIKVADGECYVQLEKGSTATSYAPYFTPIELCKIGDYQDRIYKNGDEWYLRKETTKLALSENSGFSLFTEISDVGFTFFVAIVPTPKDRQLLSNYFDTSFEGWSDLINQHIEMAQIYINNRIYLKVLTTRASSLAELNSWLANRNVVAYYALATPTDTQIINAALIKQLNALSAATTYNGSTTFTVDGNGNLAAILAVEVESSGGGGVEWDEDGAVWEEGKPSYSIISVDSIDNVYPVLTITGRTVNPVLTDVTTGTIFRYEGTITASQVLKVDMLNKTATLNGVSVIGNVTGDWLYLAPGNNRITYTADNADAPNATVEWQEIVG